jgi:hypothetical protein
MWAILALGLGSGACSDSPQPIPRDAGAAPEPLDLPTIAPTLSCVEPLAVTFACTRDADCADGARCVAAGASSQRDGAPLALTCGEALGDGKARARCDASHDCESGLCGLSSVCLAPCAKTTDCPRGQACRNVLSRFEDGLQPVMACARTLAFADDVKVFAPRREPTVDVDTLVSIASPALSDPALMFLKASCESRAEVRALSRAGGGSLFSIAALLRGDGALNPITNVGSLVPMLVPNNPGVSISAKGYVFDVVVDQPTALELVTVSRAGEHELLDLNLYYVGGGEEVRRGGLHPGDPNMRAVLDRLASRLSRMGLTLGTVREHDVVGQLRSELAVLATELVLDERNNPIDLKIERLDELFELSAGQDDSGVNLFLVSDMGDVLGISGGIPGALGAPGTSASGVAVAVDVVGLDKLETVVLHETSHHLGLFHTSEIDGFVIEPLSDTPACEPSADDDLDGVLSPRECVGRGAENLMFWAGTGSEVSAQQRQVLRQSPVLR